MRFASLIVLTALFKMEQIKICLLSGPGLWTLLSVSLHKCYWF